SPTRFDWTIASLCQTAAGSVGTTCSPTTWFAGLPKETAVMTRHSLLLVALMTALSACSGPTPKRVVDDAIAAMGGKDKLQAVRTITMKGGTGTRFRIGQTRHVGDKEDGAELKNIVEIADLEKGRASLDYDVKEGDFAQHRHEILTKRNDQLVGVE